MNKKTVFVRVENPDQFEEKVNSELDNINADPEAEIKDIKYQAYSLNGISQYTALIIVNEKD